MHIRYTYNRHIFLTYNNKNVEFCKNYRQTNNFCRTGDAADLLPVWSTLTKLGIASGSSIVS